MSQQGKESQKGSFYANLAKLNDATGLQQDAADLNDTFSDSFASLNDIFKAVEKITTDISDDIKAMMENAAVLEYGRNMSVETLNDIEAAQNITIEKQQNALGAQQDELNEKKLELATITEECYYMQDTLKQRQKTIAEMYDVVKAETSLLNEQRKVLSKLKSTTRFESKAKNLKLVEEYNALKSEYTKMSMMISQKQAENEKIRQKNSTMSDELAKIEAQSSSKAAEVAALRATFDANETKYTRVEHKNSQIMKEIEMTQQKQNDEIDRLKQAVAERRATYENAMKAKCELNDQISADIGIGVSLDENIVQAENHLTDLNVGLSELNKVLNSFSRYQESGAGSLQKNDELTNVANVAGNRPPADNQIFVQPEGRRIQPRARAQRANERADSSLQNAPKPAAKKFTKKRRSQRPERNPVRLLPLDASPDSTITDWQNNSIVPEEEVRAAERNKQSLQLFHNFFG